MFDKSKLGFLSKINKGSKKQDDLASEDAEMTAETVQATVAETEQCPVTETQVPPEAPAKVPEQPQVADAVLPEKPVEQAEEPKPAQTMDNSFMSKLLSSKQAVPKAPVQTVIELASEEEHYEVPEGDIYTDYSPEARVRRAAFNLGLRCRKDYGDPPIQVAFVKSKVAVFVEPKGGDRSNDRKFKDDGWTVLRFDTDCVEDGSAEAEIIQAAVKANMRKQKADSKKHPKKK